MRFKLLTYNILHGGKGRETLVLSVLQQTQADVILLQEVERTELVEDFAQTLKMHMFTTNGIALLSRYPIFDTDSHRSFPRIHDTVLEATISLPSGGLLHVFGVHPIHYPGSFLDIWRNWQLRIVRKRSANYATEPCLIAGDFNAIAPMDRVDTNTAPLIMRATYKLQRGKIYRSTISNIMTAGFIDCFRYLHPRTTGFTIPTTIPKVRLDYIFANAAMQPLLRRCDVGIEPREVVDASDHYPVMAEFEL